MDKWEIIIKGSPSSFYKILLHSFFFQVWTLDLIQIEINSEALIGILINNFIFFNERSVIYYL